MQEHTHTIRRGVNLMPWQIEPGDGLSKRCILVSAGFLIDFLIKTGATNPALLTLS